MRTRREFADSESLKKYLASQLVAGNVVIVLGAGISKPFGLPSWRSLVLKMYRKRRRTPDANLNLKQLAERYHDAYRKDDHVGFIQDVRNVLYDDVSIEFADLRKNALLGAISSIVLSSCRAGTRQVITFNWDDLLEKYLGYSGLLTASQWEDIFWAGNEDVTVLHPHGLIPYDPAKISSEKIVFDQLSYTKTIQDESSPKRQYLLTIMRSHVCLFIGLSGDDDHLDTLLVACQERHASQKDGRRYWGIAFNKSKKASSQWSKRGVFYHQVRDFEKDLPSFLLDVCQRAADLRRTGRF